MNIAKTSHFCKQPVTHALESLVGAHLHQSSPGTVQGPFSPSQALCSLALFPCSSTAGTSYTPLIVPNSNLQIFQFLRKNTITKYLLNNVNILHLCCITKVIKAKGSSLSEEGHPLPQYLFSLFLSLPLLPCNQIFLLRLQRFSPLLCLPSRMQTPVPHRCMSILSSSPWSGV